ncbi:MAG TPA: response regulator [Thermoanaerobaculia bacterium]|nr:response regulator [Thermoanaerobaculia bacterium]
MLVVDDEEHILNALSGYFDHLGYIVDCARTLEEAEALLDLHRYQIVLADLRLTGIEGVEGLEIISYAREKSPGTRVALLTAYGTPAIRQEALRRGADAFLNKPQPLADIARIVATLVSGFPVFSAL